MCGLWLFYREYWNDVSGGFVSIFTLFYFYVKIYVWYTRLKKIDFHNKISALSTKNSLVHFNVAPNIYIFYPHPLPTPKMGKPQTINIICVRYRKLSQKKSRKHKHNNSVAQTNWCSLPQNNKKGKIKIFLPKLKWHREHNTNYQSLKAEEEEIVRHDTFQGSKGTDQIAIVCLWMVKKV